MLMALDQQLVERLDLEDVFTAFDRCHDIGAIIPAGTSIRWAP
jgi:hypothetical protein